MLVGFDMLQRRLIREGARLIMRHKDLQLMDITKDMLKEGFQLLKDKKKWEDNNVGRMLRKLQLISAKSMCSVQSRQSYRSEVISMVVRYNVPCWYITLNPNDVNSLLALKYVIPDFKYGTERDEHGNVIKYTDAMGLLENVSKRMEAIGSDPVGCVKYFRKIVSLILKCLFGCGDDLKCESNEIGILGKVAAYWGAIENQGRGTLHIHMLIWLHGTPSIEAFRKSMNEDLMERQRVIDCLENLLRSDLHSLIDVRKYNNATAINEYQAHYTNVTR